MRSQHRREPARALARLRPRGDRGSSAIELVLYMPLLFIAIFLTVQFGLTYLGNSAASAAARETARMVRTTGDCGAASQARGEEILASVGRGVVQNVDAFIINCSDPQIAHVEVHITGMSVVPGFPASKIKQVAEGPMEEFRGDVGP